MSESLVWLCVKNNNAFLVKRGKKNSRCGATQFSKESGNLMNVNSFKYSGLANKKTIDIDHNLTLSLKVCIVFCYVGACVSWRTFIDCMISIHTCILLKLGSQEGQCPGEERCLHPPQEVC